MYGRVWEVLWDYSTSTPMTDNSLELPLPAKFIFYVKAAENKPDISFLTRFHVESVKLPEH